MTELILADDFSVLRQSRQVGSWRSLSREQRAVYERVQVDFKNLAR